MMKIQNPNSWSELPLDLLTLVFERLSFPNFQRAKSVCSSWYSASRQSVPKNQIPWLILYPKEEDKKKSSCRLFNPEEKEKVYKTQDLGVDFANTVCLATYGSWLLMKDSKYNLYILNLFTHERIDLPAVESQKLGMVKVERTIDDEFFGINDCGEILFFENSSLVSNPVFWIDEKTKDYVVLWGLGYSCVVYSKKGDKFWNQVPEILDSLDMVYKDHKLYSLSYENHFAIFDFSGEIPQKSFQSSMPLIGNDAWYICETKLVVTVSGDCLLVERKERFVSRIQSFNVYKFYSSGTYFHTEYEQVYSLGNEAMLLDLGITVPANEVEGLDSSSIYFSDRTYKPTKYNFIFNLETQTMELLHKFDLEPSTRWFLPSFSHT